MSDVMTASEAKQIMDLLQSMDKKLDVHIAKTESELKALNDKVDMKFEAVQIQIKALNDNITELRTQQRSTDGRLWAFIVGLVTLVGSGVIKVLWFDRA